MVDEEGFWRHTPLDDTEWEMASKQDPAKGLLVYLIHNKKDKRGRTICEDWLSGTFISLMKNAGETPICQRCKTAVPATGVTHAVLAAAYKVKY
jgi:hypothetical protein